MTRNLARVGAVLVSILLAACSGEVQPPVANASALQAAVTTGDVVRLNGGASKDPQGRPLFFDWSFVSVPADSAVTLLDSDKMLPSFVADMPGDYVIQLIVSNGVVRSPPVTVTVHVTACGPAPTVTATVAATVFTKVTLPAPAATDSNCLAAPTHGFRWTLLAAPVGSAAFLDNPLASQPTFTPDKVGDYRLSVVALSSLGIASPPAFVMVSAATCGFTLAPASVVAVAPPPGDTFARGTAPAFSIFAGDRVTVGAAATSTCPVGAAVRFGYKWLILEKPAGSTAALNSDTLEQPSFVADVAGTYKLQAAVTDSVGNSSTSAVLAVATRTCGGNLVNAVVTDTAGAKPFDPHVLSVTLSSDDDDGTKCPARFANTYSVAWSASATPASAAFSFGSTAGKTVAFTPLANASYVVTASIRASSGVTTSAVRAITASCTTGISAGTVSIASITPPFNDGFVRAPGQFFRDDAVTVAVAATSTCQSNPSFTASFALTDRPLGSAAAFASPRFVVDKPGSYTVAATVTDGVGNTATATNTFSAELCGANPLSAAIFDDTPGTPMPFDRRSLRVVPASADDDSLRCPARFKNAYSFSWSVTGSSSAGVGGTFGSPTAASTSFAPNGSASITVEGKVAGSNGQSATATTIVNANCAAPFVTASAISPSFTGPASPAAFPRGGSPARVYRDDRVALATTASSACFSASQATFTHEWTLTTPAGSHAALTSATAASPSFDVDLPNADYSVTVVVRDGLGNASAPQSINFRSSGCGASRIQAEIGVISGAKPLDDYTLTVKPEGSRLFFSDDDDPSICPASFATSAYTRDWTVVSSAPNTGYVFDKTTGDPVKFSPGGNAVFSVRAAVSGGGKTGTALTQIAVSCSDVIPKAGRITVASSTPGFAPGEIFQGDIATLSADPNSLCFSPGSTAFSYLWSLSATTITTAQLSSTTAANPSFPVDLAATRYSVSVIVVDKLGNRSDASSAAFTSESCGINRISAAITTSQAATAKPMDPWTLTAAPVPPKMFFSDDANPAACPARFNPSYTFTWSQTTALAATFSSTTTNPTTFIPGEPKLYGVHVLVSGNGQTGAADASVNATCGAPIVSTPTVSQVNGAPPGAIIFVGDTMKLATTVTSQCFANPTLTYAWTLKQAGLPATETFSPSATNASPSFVPTVFNGSYEASVSVSDASAQTGSPATALTINVSGCGSAAPTVSLVQATQHFDHIGRLGGTPPFPALDLIITPPATESTVIEGTDTFPVPFYLATPVAVRVQVDSASGASCPSFGFVSATMLDPDSNPLPAANFTAPGAGSVADHGSLDFSFTPRIGDRTIDQGGTLTLVPGNYLLKLTMTFGRPQTPTQSALSAATVHVGGRCGLNAPFVDAEFTPASPSTVGTLVNVSSLASDADNDPLQLTVVPTPGTNFSAGCGLMQTLTQTWDLVAPLGSATTLSATAGATTSFRPDLVGTYNVQLTVNDGTTSPAGTTVGNGTSVRSFPYDAQP